MLIAVTGLVLLKKIGDRTVVLAKFIHTIVVLANTAPKLDVHIRRVANVCGG